MGRHRSAVVTGRSRELSLLLLLLLLLLLCVAST